MNNVMFNSDLNKIDQFHVFDPKWFNFRVKVTVKRFSSSLSLVDYNLMTLKE